MKRKKCQQIVRVWRKCNKSICTQRRMRFSKETTAYASIQQRCVTQLPASISRTPDQKSAGKRSSVCNNEWGTQVCGECSSDQNVSILKSKIMVALEIGEKILHSTPEKAKQSGSKVLWLQTNKQGVVIWFRILLWILRFHFMSARPYTNKATQPY